MNAAALQPGRSSRTLALLLLVVALLIFWFGLISPLIGFYEDQGDVLAARRERADHMANLIADLPRLKKQYAQSGDTDRPSALLIESNDAVAAASLQQIVQSLARNAGLTPSSVETVPGTSIGSYRRISLRLSLSTPWPIFIRFIRAIEEARPRMVIDDLQLQVSPMFAASSPLNISLVVSAFRVQSAP